MAYLRHPHQEPEVTPTACLIVNASCSIGHSQQVIVDMSARGSLRRQATDRSHWVSGLDGERLDFRSPPSAARGVLGASSSRLRQIATLDEIADRNVQCKRQADDHVERRVDLAALDPTDVRALDQRSLSHLLLRHPQERAPCAHEPPERRGRRVLLGRLGGHLSNLGASDVTVHVG